MVERPPKLCQSRRDVLLLLKEDTALLRAPALLTALFQVIWDRMSVFDSHRPQLQGGKLCHFGQKHLTKCKCREGVILLYLDRTWLHSTLIPMVKTNHNIGKC